MSEEVKKKGGRGFASMTPERRREIAQLGGRRAHELGTAHEFSSEEAQAAGRKGGASVSRDRSHMAEIGRKGGAAKGISPNRFGTKKKDEQENEDGTAGN